MKMNKSNIEYYKESIKSIRNVMNTSIKNKRIYSQLTREEINHLNELETANLSNAIELLNDMLDFLIYENSCKNQAYFFILFENGLVDKFARFCVENPIEDFER